MTPNRCLFLTIVALLAAFLVATWHLQRESLWDDEGWSMWAVSGQDAAETLARVREDVHPPLYFLALDAWVSLAGESAYAVRLLSTLFGMVGLAATYALGKRLFDGWTGLIALIILATSGFFVYYARETRMYTLLLALAALSTWAYLRWLERPNARRAAVYAALAAAMLYAHYSGALIVLTHLIDAVLIRRRLRRVGLPYGLMFFLYLPWLLVVVAQAREHGRPLALALPSDANTVISLGLVLTSGYPLLMLVPLIVGLPGQLRRHARAIGLLVLWLVITPAALLALNASVTPVYQLRYAIAMLPAGALLVACGLRGIGYALPYLWRHIRHRMATRESFKRSSTLAARFGLGGILTLMMLTGLIAYTQLVSFAAFWPAKSRYREAAALMTASRQPYEPLIADIYWPNATAYYDRIYGIRRGAFLDVTWDQQTARQAREMVAALDPSLPVWVVMPTNVARTWDVVAALDEARGVGYRDSVMNIVFYRFDAGDGDALHFGFGDLVRYDGTITGQYAATPGDSLCVNVRLTALGSLNGDYSVSLQLLNAEGVPIAAWDGGLGSPAIGGRLALAPCLDVPADASPTDEHLQLAVYNWRTLARLPLVESDGLYWGDHLLIGSVEISR
jgi:uncharacterized membrane protein